MKFVIYLLQYTCRSNEIMLNKTLKKERNEHHLHYWAFFSVSTCFSHLFHWLLTCITNSPVSIHSLNMTSKFVGWSIPNEICSQYSFWSKFFQITSSCMTIFKPPFLSYFQNSCQFKWSLIVKIEASFRQYLNRP